VTCELLPAHDLANSPDFVSAHCRATARDGLVWISVGGQLLGCYDRDDKAAQRSLWVQVYRAGHASQTQIARHQKIGLRTFHGWVNRYRREGMAGLLDQPKSGRPPLADEAKAKLVQQSRAAGQTIYEIARLTNLSPRTINRLVGRKPAVPVEAAELALGAEAAKRVAVEVPEVANAPATMSGGEPSGLEVKAEGVPSAPEPAPVAEPAVGGEVGPSAPEPEPAAAVVSVARVEEATAVSLTSSRAGVDPLDRTPERVLARLGLLEDAEPVFAPGQHLPWVGGFLGLALLEKDPLLGVARQVFGGRLGAAFYGLRTMLVTLVLLALLRIKRPEHLRQHEAQGLGRVLGLDRAPEVKTVRGKLHALSAPLQGACLLERLARARAAEYGAEARVVYVDGHVEVYTGQYPIGQVYATSRSRVVKGTTRTWVNLPGGRPLFCVSSEFNEGLVAALPAVVAKVQAVMGPGPLIEVFDRGGYSGRLFEAQVAAGHTIITYRRGKLAAWPLEKFERKETRIGGRVYAYAPAEAEVEIPVHEEVPVASGQKGAPPQGKTGRTVRMREMRVIREDGGQTSVLAANTQASAVEVCALLFGRWGAQENVFKYLRAEYDLDATVEYGDEPLSATITHPNPAWVKGKKALAGWVARRDKLLAKLGVKLTEETLSAATLAQRLARWKRRPAAAKVEAAQAQIERLRAELATVPERVPAGQSGYRRLKSEMKLLQVALKLTAYHVETQLLERLRPHYHNHAKEGRKLIVAALRSPGSIRLQPGRILVKLGRQTSPNRTRAIAKLCEGLNELKPVYPGTTLQIVFENPLD